MKILFDKKFNLKVLEVFSSYGIFIALSILTQICSVKFFSNDISKLYLYLISIYGWGSFLGEAGFARFNISTKKFNESILYKIYLKKFFFYIVLFTLGYFLFLNIFKIFNNLGFISFIILFLFSSFFLPSTLLKRGFYKISYLPNIIFVISLFFSFLCYSYSKLDINVILLINSIITSSILYFLFIKINQKIKINYINVNIFKHDNKRIKNLNSISYLGAGIGICIFLIIGNIHENSTYLLLLRLSDGFSSMFNLLALLCIKNNILYKWRNIIWLSILPIISLLLITLFLLQFDKTINFYDIMMPIIIYILVQISGIFIGSSISQFKKESYLTILIKFNFIRLLLSVFVLVSLKVSFITIFYFNIYLYLMALLNFIPLIVLTKVSYNLSK